MARKAAVEDARRRAAVRAAQWTRAALPAAVVVAVACCALFAGGCATVPVVERELMAADIMSFDLDERERALQRVIDKSQYEGVMGGGSTEGSGCGCN